jgi:hypothetical protein
MGLVPSHSLPLGPAGAAEDAVRESPGEDGVDVTLIRWTLSLTPRERLELLQANAEALVRLQDAAASRR